MSPLPRLKPRPRPQAEVTGTTTKKKKYKSVSYFDIVRNLLEGNEYRWLEFSTGYNSFMVNRAISAYPDLVHFADRMNQTNSLPDQMQYDFYFYSIPKMRRPFVPLPQFPEDEELNDIATKYNVGLRVAAEYRKILETL